MHWNTQTIIAELVARGLAVTAQPYPGGDHDTCPLTVRLYTAPDADPIHVSGLCRRTLSKAEWNDTAIDVVEINDGLCSSGGLNSNNPDTVEAYAALRHYFAVNGATVVPHYEQFF